MNANNLVVFFNSASQLIIAERLSTTNTKLVTKNPAYLSIQASSEDATTFVGRLIPVFVPEWVKTPENGFKLTYDKSTIAYSTTSVSDNIVAEYLTLYPRAV